jgi:hypothetical protein
MQSNEWKGQGTFQRPFPGGAGGGGTDASTGAVLATLLALLGLLVVVAEIASLETGAGATEAGATGEGATTPLTGVKAETGVDGAVVVGVVDVVGAKRSGRGCAPAALLIVGTGNCRVRG